MNEPLSRRQLILLGTVAIVGTAASDHRITAADDRRDPPFPDRPFLTPGKDFEDVSRGSPLPHTLMGDDLVKARLTTESWRLEIAADDKVTMAKPRRLDDNTALDYRTLIDLGKTKSVRFLKAMQCNNIALPLGQGLWEGVLLRDVLALCGVYDNARRLYYWGFHNNDPKQIFRSSLAMSQVLDSPPGEMPPFLAYSLNAEPLSLTRGGPVRMVVPWAHGFKSVKWLQHIVLTNRFDANDTYAERNNDPESYLKTAAYFDSTKAATFPSGKPVVIRGTAMVGWPGVERVEYWLRPNPGTNGALAEDDPVWTTAKWQPAIIDPLPKDWHRELPAGYSPKEIWGFAADGTPKEWPLRYSICHWSLKLTDLKPGKYELRMRTVDKNGFAQPDPRSGQRSGKNLISNRVITIT